MKLEQTLFTFTGTNAFCKTVVSTPPADIVKAFAEGGKSSIPLIGEDRLPF